MPITDTIQKFRTLLYMKFSSECCSETLEYSALGLYYPNGISTLDLYGSESFA